MPTVSVNTHFPGYEIIGELGRSNARVLKARHLDTGDLVAIKHFALNTDAETLRRFRLESQLMTDIRHPNVVRVREVQLDMSMPFIVMEWIEGGNLRSLLSEQGYLDVPTTIRLGQQMAEAFKAIHPRGIIHRDIKPENILFRPLPSGELHFLLTDFGVARLREQSQTMTGQSLMTYEYASPEQFDNPRGVDVATDYYSLGVVLYECLSGRVPFSMTDNAGIATFMGQVLRTPPPDLVLPSGQQVPPSLHTLLDWTLAKNPAERLSDVNELVLLLGHATIEQLQAGRSSDRQVPVSSRTMAAPVPEPTEPISSTYEEEPPRKINGWGIGLGLLIAVLFIGLAIVFVNQRKSTRTGTKIMPDSTVMKSDSSEADVTAEDTATTSSDYPIETVTDSTTIPESNTAPTSEPSPTTISPIVTDSSSVVVDSTKTPN
ncbi:serine/threonine-protein kinase [Spirosoma validum]|uniref:non-specific serine/threonine protein kinase n=1 Tax=Spirosoma validum TaxID=2771355 RepID=A0A927GFI5_9BACT|nr:serine/threonine-protein kinase [Spirosoma validum]MBD2755831.1 protein kinase [Spirosoma validum]